MARKLDSRTAAAAVAAMLGAAKPLPEVPSCVRVREGDIPFLNAILRSRNREEWSEVDLMVAGQLARTQADIEMESRALEVEGSVLENARGAMVMNPRHTVLEQLTRREMAMARAITLIGVVAKGDKKDQANSRSLQRQSVKIKQELEDDELLA